MSKKYAMYVGRWQNWHKGHEWLLNQQLEKGKDVWVNEFRETKGRIKFCEEMLATLKPCESLTKPRISCEKHSEGLK